MSSFSRNSQSDLSVPAIADDFVDLQNGFHGRTYGAMALTTSKTYYRANFGPLMPGVFVAPYPYCLHCKARQASPSGNDWYTVSYVAYQIPPYCPHLRCAAPTIIGFGV